MHWTEKYFSIPFEPNKSSMQSCDCAGLVFLVLQNELKLDLQRGEDVDFTAKNKHEVFKQFFDIIEEIPLEDIKPFDIFYQCTGASMHTGVVVDSATIIESTDKTGVKMRSILNILAKPTKFYRLKHEKRA